MSSIKKSGFLSEQMSEWIAKNREKNSAWFKLCENINEFSHSTMLNIKIHNRYLPEVIVATLYARAMSNFQGIILMAERGMINEAKSLLRCFLECMFAIVAIEKDKTIVNQFVFDDFLQRKDGLKTIKRNKGAGTPLFAGAPPMEDIDNQLLSIEKQIKKNNVIKLTKRALAEKAGMLTTYDTAYKILSGTIHVNARDLEQYLRINEAREIKSILWGPNVKEIDFILFNDAEAMLFILKAISHFFSLSFTDTDKWRLIWDTYDKLSKQFYEKND
jgi:hypothetical protein